MQKALREVENFAIHLAQTIQNTILRKLIKQKMTPLIFNLNKLSYFTRQIASKHKV